MARGKKKNVDEAEATDMDPSASAEAIERKRLKALAFSTGILSNVPAGESGSVHLKPSSTVVKHHGKDIIKKSQRKSTRFLFSFPGLLAPVAGGKIGELKDLGTKNPILYLDFPQGQMKLFGTIVYPKNRYLTLQFSRGGKNVMCEDSFDNMIVFSDAWWIGRKDENPEEAKLEFPKELYEGQQTEYDFKGGAGANSAVNKAVPKFENQCAEPDSPKTPIDNDLSDSEMNSKDTKEVVPVRHSGRTTRKSYKVAEVSSDEGSGESSPNLSEDEEKLEKRPCPVVVDIDNEDDTEVDQLQKENKEHASGLKSKKVPRSASATASNEVVSSNNASLVQPTIATLFKKAEEKASTSMRKPQSSKVSGQKLQPGGSKRKIDQDGGPKKRGRKPKDKNSGEHITVKRKGRKVEDDDDIEEFSNASEDEDDSDEDWTA
ncbi:hypothetical protein PIB30_016656 [Stylosanthes scabra]|uniref:DNA-binding protein RHL1 n=1 Tax=Stylosanthes scabra TaxID=79078 RepID=A0ABU6W5X4_9FABA|nr:hypothetical protein [Stylosanthes scabra]